MATHIEPANSAESSDAAVPTAQVGGVTVQIARWLDDKAAAVSLRFDDAHPSHLDIAIPLLNRYGMVGTFLIQPGREAYQQRRQEWERAIRDGGHELGDEKWRAIQVRNHASVSSVPDQVAISNLEALVQQVDKAIADGDSASFDFHAIGPGEGTGIGEQLFRDMMAALYAKRRELWFGGVAQVHKYETERRAASVTAEMVAPQRLRIELDFRTDPALYDQPLTLRVDLPRTWSGEDVQALDANQKPIPIRRTTEQWLRPPIAVPPVRGTYYVQELDPRKGQPPPALPAESERTARDPANGVVAGICKWLDGKQAALSIRFDDSHPTHILHVVPLLRRYGYKGTFMINPGRPGYQGHKAEWEACAAAGDHEFANHTHNHRGCTDDDDADRELGECSRYIWSVFPNKSKLLAMNRGGATTWTITTPFRHWLDKYHLFIPPGGGISMADEYGPRLPIFERRLAETLERGAWLQTHYHAIGEGHLRMTEENFATVLEMTKRHEDRLWIAGIADIYKYQQEREAATLSMWGDGPDRLRLQLQCSTDAELYDQPLTLELRLPETWPPATVAVRDANGQPMPIRTARGNGGSVVRFDVPPRDGTYVVAR